MEEVLRQLRKISLKRSEDVKSFKKRFAFNFILERLGKEPKVKLVRGFRGVGKTTLILQLSSELENSVYFSADHPLVKETGLYRVIKGFAGEGFNPIFIDEIHTYERWEGVLKNISDEYPEISVVATGSAPLAFYPERRFEFIDLEPMSFSEFVFMKYGKKYKVGEHLFLDEESSFEFVAKNPELESYFKKYLSFGGFPICLRMGDEESLRAIYYSIIKSIREDSLRFLRISPKKVFAMEKLLIVLAVSKPWDLSITSLSRLLEVSKSTVYELVDALKRMKIIRVIYPEPSASSLRNEPKLLFYHPNLRYAINFMLGRVPDTGAVREELFVFSASLAGFEVYSARGSRKRPDYVIVKGDFKEIVEIGGRGKGKAQVGKKGKVIKPEQLVTLSMVATSTIFSKF